MNTTSFDPDSRTIRMHGLLDKCSTCHGFVNSDVKFYTKGLRINSRFQRKGSCSLNWNRYCTIKASSCHSSLVNPIMFSGSNNNNFDEISNESSLILIRNGESYWNEMNFFSGCIDVPLTEKGIEEAIEAGRRISSIPIDIIFTSELARAQMTAMLAMTQHNRQKFRAVPEKLISESDKLRSKTEQSFMSCPCRLNPKLLSYSFCARVTHNRTEQAKLWTQIHNENTKNESIPVVRAWQLNERMYGDLQGFNKKETAKLYGKEQVHAWRRTYYTCPPNGESLEMTSKRAVAYFREHIEPQLLLGKHVMVAAHANSLRAIIMYLDKLTSEEVISLELSNGTAILYIYTEGRFIRRGSLLEPAEAGVYAFTGNLALYREKFDEMPRVIDEHKFSSI